MERNTILHRIKNNALNLDAELYLGGFVLNVKDIFLALKSNNKITKFELKYSRTFSIDYDELSSFLEKNESLTELDLSNNYIDDDLTNLCMGIINNHTLIELGCGHPEWDGCNV